MNRRDFFKKARDVIGGSALVAALPNLQLPSIPTTGDPSVNVGFQPEQVIIYDPVEVDEMVEFVAFHKDGFTVNTSW